jgi:hypothetical protein
MIQPIRLSLYDKARAKIEIFPVNDEVMVTIGAGPFSVCVHLTPHEALAVITAMHQAVDTVSTSVTGK